MQVEIVQRQRDAVFAQIAGGGADDQLQREQPAGDQPVLRGDADPQPHVDPLLHPVADAIV
ncbi:hypothetical protein D3C79_1097770 [compost metagenome]